MGAFFAPIICSCIVVVVMSGCSQAKSVKRDTIDHACTHGLSMEQASIARVGDGDTVVLSDKRRVRLIGINTAELNAPAPPLRDYAEQAKAALAELLPEGERVNLYLGVDPTDRHGRVLAHVVRARDDLAVAQWLVQRGLAVQSSVAPNILCATQFADLETQARTDRVGLWKTHNPMRVNAASVNTQHRGFHIVSGKVTSVHRRKRYSDVLVDDKLHLRVRPELAQQLSLARLVGQNIEVRGWLSHRKQQVVLWLQHAANLREVNH